MHNTQFDLSMGSLRLENAVWYISQESTLSKWFGKPLYKDCEVKILKLVLEKVFGESIYFLQSESATMCWSFFLYQELLSISMPSISIYLSASLSYLYLYSYNFLSISIFIYISVFLYIILPPWMVSSAPLQCCAWAGFVNDHSYFHSKGWNSLNMKYPTSCCRCQLRNVFPCAGEELCLD